MAIREGERNGLGPQLRAELDEIPVSKLAEYLCERVQLAEGRTMLQFKFASGRYDRMRRYTLSPDAR